MGEEDTGELVLSNIEGSVGYIIFNRPDRLNAFNLALAEQFLDIANNFSKDETVRAIVIRGNKKVFSAGGDVKEMLNDVREGKDRAAYFRDPLAAFNNMTHALIVSPKPVVAAVHGVVAGVAFNLMLGCDLRIAKEGTRFAQAFVKIGLSPDGGGTYFLPRMVGYARACELTMLPTEIDAKTALNWGLINQVVSADIFENVVRKTSEKLANGPTLAIGRTKSLLNQTFERSLTEQMEAERLVQIENAASENFEEGLKAFTEKRQPKFSNH
jgi:2-(1,2-epoxy-1,2-dihydrophenyl)acetyl-CoA isomerase